MHKRLIIAAVAVLTSTSCINDSNDDPLIDEPATYDFTRNGESTVSFTGQTARIKMATELIGAMNDFDNSTEELLLQMYRNQTEEGGDANPFSDPDLNNETKNIKSKVAASQDYFSANTTVSAEIKNQFEEWISAQVNEVYPNENSLAEPGQAGQIADGSSARYVNTQGLEYNQLVNKSLIGALMADQMLNNYLSVSVLDAGSNRGDNTNGTLAEGANYTNMEHKWDEAYGYLYGTAANKANPTPTVGNDDSFLNKYLGSVNSDDDFAGIAEDVFNAFKRGRAAIVSGNYEVRDDQAWIIRENISKVIAVRAVHYLLSGKQIMEQDTPDYGAAFHDLSEAYGFIFSLQFTKVPEAGVPYFSTAEVNGFLDDLMGDGPNGLWDVTPETLDAIATEIAGAFDFTIEQITN